MNDTLKADFKKFLYRWFPRLTTEVFSARARALSQRLTASWGCSALNDKLIERYGSKVLHGAFEGMILTPMTRKEHLAPYLLGIYECELESAWDTIFSLKLNQIVDIGSKIGYYAAGLARRFPEAEVIAFDTDRWARAATREMLRANQIANTKVLGFCGPEWFPRNLKENAFLLSDCEGYEAVLFGKCDPRTFATATMLIEIHEQFSPGVSEAIRSNFTGTHDIEVIGAATSSKLPFELKDFTADEQAMATSEYRTAQQSWFLLTPKVLTPVGA